MGTGSFPGVKWLGHGADYPPPHSAEVENEYSYTSTPTSRPLVAYYRVTLTFFFFTVHFNMSVSFIVTKVSVLLQLCKQAVKIRMVEHNHKTIVDCEKACIINSFIL
jgi:hypothetical protein